MVELATADVFCIHRSFVSTFKLRSKFTIFAEVTSFPSALCINPAFRQRNLFGVVCECILCCNFLLAIPSIGLFYLFELSVMNYYTFSDCAWHHRLLAMVWKLILIVFGLFLSLVRSSIKYRKYIYLRYWNEKIPVVMFTLMVTVHTECWAKL